MQITVYKREAKKRGELTKIRMQGNIPAVVYRQGERSDPVFIDGNEFKKVLQHIAEGYLSNTVFELIDEKGKHTSAIVKDVQYHPTTYDIIHLDFDRVVKEKPITVLVPIRCTGMEQCAGIKHGGILRQPIRNMKVRGLSKDLPKEFVIDVSAMEIGDSKKLADITIPPNVLVKARMQEVVVIMGRS